VRNFWQRVSEGGRSRICGRNLPRTRAPLRFYGGDVDGRNQEAARWHRPLHVAKEFFWALILKLTPARRVLFLASTAMLIFSRTIEFELESAARRFLLLLSLELADKVTMKRDLKSRAKFKAGWCHRFRRRYPAQSAFASRRKIRAGDYYDAFFAHAGYGWRKLMLVIADVAGKSIPARC